jgi:hypothetical protein
MPPIQYSLVYEHSYWKDASFIEPDSEAWANLSNAFEDILERTPEIHPVVRSDGGRILPTLKHISSHEMPSMFVLYRILKPAPDGKVQVIRVAKEEDVRAGRFPSIGQVEDVDQVPFRAPLE